MTNQAQSKRIIVDAQVHLWKAQSPDRPWNSEATGPQLPEPMTMERLVPMMDEAGVDKAIIVPPTLEGLRFDYGQEAARRHPGRFATMTRINLNDPNEQRRMQSMSSEFAWLGWRHAFMPAHARWLPDGLTDWFWPLAEKLGHPVMVLAPGQTALFNAIAERHPQLQLIIDHMGVVLGDVKDGTLSQRVAETAALAGHSNVSVKLSSIPLFSKKKYPWRDMNDHIKRLFDAYGPQRCHWGTDLTANHTRTAIYSSLKQRVTHFTEELAFLSEADLDWIMGRSILRKLRWVIRDSSLKR